MDYGEDALVTFTLMRDLSCPTTGAAFELLDHAECNDVMWDIGFSFDRNSATQPYAPWTGRLQKRRCARLTLCVCYAWAITRTNADYPSNFTDAALSSLYHVGGQQRYGRNGQKREVVDLRAYRLVTELATHTHTYTRLSERHVKASLQQVPNPTCALIRLSG